MVESDQTVLQRLCNESRADAAGADLYSQDASVLFNRLNFLEIRIPYRTGFIVCMADVITEARAFSTNFAFS
jgi:hypothetical protein